MEKYKIEKMCDTRYFVHFKETNKKGEKLTIEVTKMKYDKKDNLPELWLKNGYTKYLYKSAIWIDTFCTLENGNCVGKYNPTHKLSEDKKRMVIDFDNLLEVSEENEQKLINMIYNLFMESKEA